MNTIPARASRTQRTTQDDIDEVPDSYYDTRLPTSARRYVDTHGNPEKAHPLDAVYRYRHVSHANYLVWCSDGGYNTRRTVPTAFPGHTRLTPSCTQVIPLTIFPTTFS